MVGDKDGEGECGREGELGEGGREGLGVNAGMGQQRGTEDGLLPQKGLRKFSFRATFERCWLLLQYWQMLEAKPQIWIVMRQCLLICWFNIWTTQLAPQHLLSNIDTDQQFNLICRDWSPPQ